MDNINGKEKGKRRMAKKGVKEINGKEKGGGEKWRVKGRRREIDKKREKKR